MRILFVAETSSIHGARWVNQFSDCNWDLHVAQGTFPFTGINPEYRTGIFHCPFPIRNLTDFRGSLSQKTCGSFSTIVARIPRFNEFIQAKIHAKLIETIRPDIIHTLGLNINWRNNCKVTYRAKKMLGKKFTAPWLYSTWGSDLDYYLKQSKENLQDISKILPSVDYLITECQRDERLAFMYGFKGKCLGHLPAFGGISLEEYSKLRQTGKPSLRRIIFLKGRDHTGGGDPVGRAMTAMNAFEICEKELKGYKIVINQASPSIVKKANDLRDTTSLDIRVLQYLPYNEILRMLGSSKIFIALTVNDGLPSTLVESMALGAFPIHSDLEPIREWITDKENGLLISPTNPEECAQAIITAIQGDNLVNAAADTNATLVSDKLSTEVVRKQALEIYEKILKTGQVIQE